LLSVFPLYANLHVQGQLSLGICTAYLVCILKLLTFGLIGSHFFPGFEKDMFKLKNEKQAMEQEAYLWSVSDM